MQGFGDYDYGEGNDTEAKVDYDENYDGDFEGDNNLPNNNVEDDNDLNRRKFKLRSKVNNIDNYSISAKSSNQYYANRDPKNYVEELDTLQGPQQKQFVSPIFKISRKELGTSAQKYPDIIALVDKAYNRNSFSQNRPKIIISPRHRRRRLPRLFNYVRNT